MHIPFLTLILACGGGPAEVPDAPEPAVVDPGPGQMPDLAVLEHPDLVLGSLRKAPDSLEDWYPKPTGGAWSLRRLWRSNRGKDWSAGDVQLVWNASVAPIHEEHHLTPVDEDMQVRLSRHYRRTGPNWGVVATRQEPQTEHTDLGRTEILLAPTGVVFHSPFTLQKVTVEVVGVQQVTVPAGSFDALRIRRASAQGLRSSTEEAWWAPDHGLIARVQRVQTNDQVDARMMVLAEFGDTEDPSVLRQVWADGRTTMGLKE